MHTNFPGGRWQQHSHHDTLENVSVAQVQHLLRATHVLAADLASRTTWPFRSRLPASQQAEANRIGRNCLGPGTRTR